MQSEVQFAAWYKVTKAGAWRWATSAATEAGAERALRAFLGARNIKAAETTIRPAGQRPADVMRAHPREEVERYD